MRKKSPNSKEGTRDAFQELDSFLFTDQAETSIEKNHQTTILTALKLPFNFHSLKKKKKNARMQDTNLDGSVVVVSQL